MPTDSSRPTSARVEPARLAPSERAIVAALENASLPPEAFTHAEHVRLAWAYLRASPLLRALARFRATLQGYAAAHGKHGLYHETVTLAYMLLVHERMVGAPPGEDWSAFATRNADLLVWCDGPFFDYYPAGVLGDAEARARFVLPPAA